MRERFSSSTSMNSMPMPGTWFDGLSNSCTRITRPVRSKGNAASGSETMRRTTLPTASGLRVLMKMPPRLMFTAQSVMKPSTVR
jgi:hypothetical protein